MRKLTMIVAALFLFGSVPAFAQTSGSATEKSETKTETTPSGDSTTTTKKSTKKHKKSTKKHKADKMGAADAGM
jgi:hypothetical protein